MNPYVICDTNIWYGIGKGTINPKEFKGYDLVATFLNIQELVHTKNRLDKPDIVKKACQAIKNYASRIIWDDFATHILKTERNLKAIGNYSIELYLKFNEILNVGFFDIGELRKKIDKRDAFGIEGTEIAKEMIKKVKANITDKKTHRKGKYIQSVKEFISKVIVSQFFDYRYSLSPNFQWDNIELLLKTYLSFFTELEISAMIFVQNDWIDCFNLTYVQPIDYYWTKERRWIKQIKAAGCEYYLFKG